MTALRALGDGFRALRRSFGLPALLLVVNLLTAAVLAAPLASEMQRSLAQTSSQR